jgi:hypothetical protein
MMSQPSIVEPAVTGCRPCGETAGGKDLQRQHGLGVTPLDVDRHRAGEEAAKTTSGLTRRSASPPLPGLRGELVEVALRPGADIVDEGSPVPGLEHHIWVLEGVVEVTIGDQAQQAQAGDRLRFRLWDRWWFAARATIRSATPSSSCVPDATPCGCPGHSRDTAPHPYLREEQECVVGLPPPSRHG